MRATPRQRFTAIVVCCLLCGGAAAHADEVLARAGPGAVWYFTVKTSFLEVGQNGLVLGAPDITVPGDHPIVGLDFKARPGFEASIGRADGFADLRLTYFIYRQIAKVSADAGGAFINVNFGTPNTATPQFNHIDGTGRLETHQIDVTFSRPLIQETLTQFSWVLGLRGWMLNEKITADGFNRKGGLSDHNETITDSRGAGITAGLRGKARMTSWLTGHAGMTSGFLTGRQDTQDNDASFIPGLVVNNFARNGVSKNFMQAQFEAFLDFGPWHGASLFLGYEYRWLGDALGKIDFTLNGDGIGTTLNSSSLTFSGIETGFSVRF